VTAIPATPVDVPRGSPRVAWRLLRNDPGAYLIALGSWVLFWCLPLGSGFLLKGVLDHVATDATGVSVWAVLAVLGAFEVGRWLDLWFSAVQWHGAWAGWLTVPRLNILRSLAVDPGPASDRLPGSPGDAVSRFRDDCQDLAAVLDVWLDFSGAIVSGAVAFTVMALIDLRATLLVALPIVVVLGVATWLTPKLRAWRRQARYPPARSATSVSPRSSRSTAASEEA